MGASAVIPTILGFAAVVGIGMMLRHVGLLAEQDSKPLNVVILYVGLPAFIFHAVHSADLSADVIRVVAVAWGVTLVVGMVAWGVAKALRLSPRSTAAFLLVAALGNTGYIGYPLVQAILGEAAVSAAIFYDVFGTLFALVLLGMPIAAEMGHAKGERLNVLTELLAFPAIGALLLGIALHEVAIPVPVMEWFGFLGNMVTPLVMLSVGLSLKPRSIIDSWKEVAAASALRLFVAPFLASLLVMLLRLSSEQAAVAVLEAGMPSMVLSLAVGERFGLDTESIASVVFSTTVLSIVTIPVVQALLA